MKTTINDPVHAGVPEGDVLGTYYAELPWKYTMVWICLHACGQTNKDWCSTDQGLIATCRACGKRSKVRPNLKRVEKG